MNGKATIQFPPSSGMDELFSKLHSDEFNEYEVAPGLGTNPSTSLVDTYASSIHSNEVLFLYLYGWRN